LSRLRKQLQADRDSYRSIRYSGDLAADLSVASGSTASSGPSTSRWISVAASVAAVVAVGLLALVVARRAAAPLSDDGGIGMAVVTNEPDALTAPSDEMFADATPTLWNSFESVPSLFESLGTDASGVPSFPSFEEVSQSIEPTALEEQK
jgi:hypothetical protein